MLEVASEEMDDTDSKAFKFKSEICTWINKAQEYVEARSNASSKTSSTRSQLSRKSKASSKSRHSVNSQGSHNSNVSKGSNRTISESLNDQKALIAGLKVEKTLIEECKAAETKAELMRVDQEISKAEAIVSVYQEKEIESKRFRKQAKNMLKKKDHVKLRGKVKSDICLLTDSLRQLMKLQSAPDVEIDNFSGDYMEYKYFMATFKEVVERKIEDPMGRLTKLIKFTSGNVSLRNSLNTVFKKTQPTAMI